MVKPPIRPGGLGIWPAELKLTENPVSMGNVPTKLYNSMLIPSQVNDLKRLAGLYV